MRFSFSLLACNSLFSVFPLSLSVSLCRGLAASHVVWVCVCGMWLVLVGYQTSLRDVSVPLKRGCRCQSNFPLFVIFPPFYLSGSSGSPCVKTAKRPCLSDASESMSKAARGGIFDLRKWTGCFKKINCSHDNLASRHAGLNKLDYFAFNLHMFLCADSFANGKREILNIFSPGLRKHNYWFIW